MINSLKQKLKSIALADAILCPEWEYRYFSYDSQWAKDEEMGSMRDGSGGHRFIVIKNDEISYKCISPEDGLIENLKDIKNQIPNCHNNFLDEPAFYIDYASSFWFSKNNSWNKYGNKNIKWIIDLEQIINWTPSDYKKWAEEYYERDIDEVNLIKVFNHEINEDIVKSLNSDISISDIKNDIIEIGVNL